VSRYGGAVRQAYLDVLQRDADSGGLKHHSARMARGLTDEQLRRELEESPEFSDREVGRAALDAVQTARLVWIRSLPAASRIVDLGGSSVTHPCGALVEMGYSHSFEELIIVDLPQDDRDTQFQSQVLPDNVVESDAGTVRYRYHSMTDLSAIDDGSIDLIVSGQSFEHVTREDGELVLDEAHRVLTHDGLLALDTPNRALTKIQMQDSEDEFINPDHKIEYEHHEMLELFAAHGLAVVTCRGLNHLPEAARTRRFELAELATSPPLHDDIEDCYLLAYLAKRTE
jgi:SAM-dependent methyltransferase